MANLNKVILLGNVTKKPIVNYSPNGSAYGSLVIAVNNPYKDKNTQEWKNNTDFITVNVYNKTAENCAEYLDKGSLVCVDGKLNVQQWKNEKEESRSRLVVIGNNIQFINTKSNKSKDDATENESNTEKGNDNEEPIVESENSDIIDDDEEELPF